MRKHPKKTPINAELHILSNICNMLLCQTEVCDSCEIHNQQRTKALSRLRLISKQTRADLSFYQQVFCIIVSISVLN